MCHWLKQLFATCTATRQNASESYRRPHLALSHWHWFYFTCKSQCTSWKQVKCGIKNWLYYQSEMQRVFPIHWKTQLHIYKVTSCFVQWKQNTMLSAQHQNMSSSFHQRHIESDISNLQSSTSPQHPNTIQCLVLGDNNRALLVTNRSLSTPSTTVEYCGEIFISNVTALGSPSFAHCHHPFPYIHDALHICLCKIFMNCLSFSCSQHLHITLWIRLTKPLPKIMKHFVSCWIEVVFGNPTH